MDYINDGLFIVILALIFWGIVSELTISRIANKLPGVSKTELHKHMQSCSLTFRFMFWIMCPIYIFKQLIRHALKRIK